MKENIAVTASRLSDEALLVRTKELASRERVATADLIAHLAEVDARKAYLAAGAASSYRYCIEVLHLSEHAAYHRIHAARAARRFPLILDLLADGSVNVTTVTLLAPHLTPENHRAVLRKTAYGSKADVEVIVAGLAPRADVPSTIRKLPERPSAPPPPAPQLALHAPDAAPGAASLLATPAAPHRRPRRRPHPQPRPGRPWLP